MIKLENLNKYYNKGKSNELHVINQTSITLPDTGLICILGESGSGKTTLMNTISGLDDFQGGSIEVDGMVIEKYGDKNQENIRNAKFGYIFQNYYLLMDRTVEYNILLALSMYEISDEEKEARIEYVLKAVDMWRYKKRPVGELSGGQQQRIAIARALAKSPKVIFADEPTGNLDEANTMNIMGILKKISANCLVVVVTHEKNIADFFADKILWICDGRIEREQDREGQSVYQYVDDNNLYLQEFSKRELTCNDVELEIYDHAETPKITLQVVYEDGKLYLGMKENGPVEFLTDVSEKKIVDSKRPVAQMKDVNEISFELEEMKNVKNPKISPKEIVDIAMSNLRAMRARQILLAVVLFTISVLIVISVADILSVLNVDRQQVVSTDSHYYTVTAEKKGLISDNDYRDAFLNLLEQLEESGFKPNIKPATKLTYQYSGFRQLENYEITFPECSFVSSAYLEEKDLVYGTLPTNIREIVVDEWMVEKLKDSSHEIQNIIADASQMVGNTVMTKQGYQLTIVGISRTEEPDIYITDELMAMIAGTTLNFMTESAAAELSEEYEAANLGITEDGNIEVLVPESLLREKYSNYLGRQYRKNGYILGDENDYESYSYTGALTSTLQYVVVGCFPDNLGVDYIVPDEALESISNAMMGIYKRCNIYLDAADQSEAVQMIKDSIQDEDILNKLTITVKNQSAQELAAYRKENDEKFGGRILITITIFLISMVILYFMMRANAINRMQDLGVYRMLGISKKDIMGMFVYENFLISSYTSLPGVLLTTGITMGLSKIKALEVGLTYPWYAALLTILFLYFANILVGIMPIRKMLKLPPAQLAAKYDV